MAGGRPERTSSECHRLCLVAQAGQTDRDAWCRTCRRRHVHAIQTAAHRSLRRSVARCQQTLHNTEDNRRGTRGRSVYRRKERPVHHRHATRHVALRPRQLPQSLSHGRQDATPRHTTHHRAPIDKRMDCRHRMLRLRRQPAILGMESGRDGCPVDAQCRVGNGGRHI